MQEPSDHEQLTALLDGELTDAEVAELEHRLARDAELRAEFDGLKRAVDVLRTRGPVQAPPGLLGEVLRRVESEPAPGGWSAWWQRPFGLPWAGLGVGGAAMAVVAISVAATSLTWTGEDPLAAGRGLAPWESKSSSEQSAEDPAPTKPENAVPSRVAAGPESKGGPPRRVPPAGDPPAQAGSASEKPVLEPESGDGPAAAGTPPGTSTDGTDSPALYPVARHRVSVSPADLETIARLYAKYGSSAGAGAASDLAGLGRGDHTVTLDLRDTAARNAFLQELQRQFGSAYVENAPAKDTLTLDASRVDLQVYVNDYVPSSVKQAGPKKGDP